ncbi:MAG: hypothetical protein ISS53_00775 [Dehalococcoidia bacterium]|nr:hypothetical protein [Dehalococcoidia bacterium]
MDNKDPFWKRAFRSVRAFLNRPVGAPKRRPTEPAEARRQQPARPGEDEERFAPPTEEAEQVFTRPETLRAKTAKKQLLGQEFDIVDEGLSEEQVVGLVNDLMGKCRALEEQQKSFLSLGSLTERAAVEADKAAASIKARARSQAEAEAARITAEANQRTQDMMVEAKKAAQEATQQEVQNILQAALRKAAIVELQAKQQAQLFLIRSREAIEGDLREEVKGAYYRLISCLQNVLGEGNRLELEWKDRTGQLRKRERFELEGYRAGQSALAAEIAATPPLSAGEGGAEADVAGETEE